MPRPQRDARRRRRRPVRRPSEFGPAEVEFEHFRSPQAHERAARVDVYTVAVGAITELADHPLPATGTPLYYQVTLDNGGLAPRFTLAGEELAPTRIGPTTWQFELLEDWDEPEAVALRTGVLEVLVAEGYEQPETKRVVHAVYAMVAAPAYSLMDQFDQQCVIAKWAYGADPTDDAASIYSARLAFYDVELMQQFPHFPEGHPDTGAVDMTRYDEHFAGYARSSELTTVAGSDRIPYVVGLTKILSQCALWRAENYTVRAPDQPSTYVWDDCATVKETAILVAQSIASIFAYHHQTDDGAFDATAAQRSVLLFASGLSRLDSVVDDTGGIPVLSDLFNAEPNGNQFKWLAEFGQIAVHAMTEAELGTDEREVWKALLPACVVGIDLYCRSFLPIPLIGESSTRLSSPSVLRERLQLGRDPRPTLDDLDRASALVGKLAEPDATHLYDLWGYYLWTLDSIATFGSLDYFVKPDHLPSKEIDLCKYTE